MRLPDPNVPIQGKQFVINATIVILAFTIAMAALTYGCAIGWAALHHQPQPLPPQGGNAKE